MVASTSTASGGSSRSLWRLPLREARCRLRTSRRDGSPSRDATSGGTACSRRRRADLRRRTPVPHAPAARRGGRTAAAHRLRRPLPRRSRIRPARGAGRAALHVADGSQILSRRVGGRALTVGVGARRRERYGSCLSRLAPPRLADGYCRSSRRGTSMRPASATRRSRSRRGPLATGAARTSFVRLDRRRPRAREPHHGAIRLVAGRPDVPSCRRVRRCDVYVSWAAPAGDEPQPTSRSRTTSARARPSSRTGAAARRGRRSTCRSGAS